jgi:hypothetical protein
LLFFYKQLSFSLKPSHYITEKPISRKKQKLRDIREKVEKNNFKEFRKVERK